MAGTFPQFRPERLRAPLLWIACAPANSLPGFGEGSFQEKAVYSERVKAVFPGLEHHDFSSMSSLQRRRAQGAATDWSSATASYEAACRIILGFLESRLNGVPRRLDLEPEALCKVTFRPARKAAPSALDFRETLLKDGLSKAAELIRIIQKGYPEDLPALEAPMTAAAYEVLGAGRAKTAIGVFALTVETYPDSFNASDSLGEAYLAEGSLEEAQRCYAEARSKLEHDPRLPVEQRAEQRARIDKILADIRVKQGGGGDPAR
jgi:tetratricopeptide (TPR) repeat protein